MFRTFWWRRWIIKGGERRRHVDYERAVDERKSHRLQVLAARARTSRELRFTLFQPRRGERVSELLAGCPARDERHVSKSAARGSEGRTPRLPPRRMKTS